MEIQVARKLKLKIYYCKQILSAYINFNTNDEESFGICSNYFNLC